MFEDTTVGEFLIGLLFTCICGLIFIVFGMKDGSGRNY